MVTRTLRDIAFASSLHSKMTLLERAEYMLKDHQGDPKSFHVIEMFSEEFRNDLRNQYNKTRCGYMVTCSVDNFIPHGLIMTAFGRGITQVDIHLTTNHLTRAALDTLGEWLSCCSNLQRLGFIYLPYGGMVASWYLASLIANLPQLRAIFIAHGYFPDDDVNTEICSKLILALDRLDRTIRLIVNAKDMGEQYREYFRNFKQYHPGQNRIDVVVANDVENMKDIIDVS